MKCPKCQYVGFEETTRCRNCGYDFSLATPPAGPASGRTRSRADSTPADDLALRTPPNATLSEGARDRRSRLAGQGGADAALDLPLFGESTRRAEPPPAGIPLSVRRATPEAARSQTRTSQPELTTALLDLEPQPSPPAPASAACAQAPAPPGSAGAWRRIVAGLLDAALMFGIDVAVLYLTLRVLELTVADLAALPPLPIVAFLSLLNGGYLIAFTVAGGQTLGKMTTGIKVVDDERAAQVDLRQAALRTISCLVSVLPVGLGFAAALVGPEGRSFHDRLAGTRVIRVG